MRTLTVFILLAMFGSALSAQVKIGQNPESIDPASILELDDDTKALVLTRMSDANMNAMSPLRGAMVYNIDFGCVYYYNGGEWLNLCNAGGGTTNESLVLQDNELILTDSEGAQVSVLLETITEQTFTTDPIQNFRETILITQTGNNYNFEVSEITGEQIADFTIQGIDIAEESIRSNNLAPNSVGQSELSENSVADLEIDYSQVTLNDFTNDAGYITNAQIVSPDVGNDITDSNGSYYDDSPLQTAIDSNTANLSQHLAEDNDTDPTNEIVTELRLDGNNLIIAEGTNTQSVSLEGFSNAGSDDQQLTLNGNLLTLEDGGDPIDLSPFTGTGTDDQNLGPADLSPANVLTLNIENGDPVSVDLSALAGGGAVDGVVSDVAFDGTNLNFTGANGGFNGNVDISALGGGGAADGSETIVTAGANIVVAGTGTPADPYIIGLLDDGSNDGRVTDVELNGTDLEFTGVNGGFTGTVPLAGLGGGSTELADGTTIIGDGTAGDRFRIAPSAFNGQYLRTDPTTGDVIWDDLPAGTGGNTVFTDNATIIGDGQGTPLTLGNLGATNGQILKWNAGTTAWEAQDDRNATNIFFGFQDSPFTGNRELFVRDSEGNEVGVEVAELQAEIGTGGGGSPTDEIQDLQLDGGTNILTITDNAAATPIDLSPYLDDTNTTNTSLTQDGTNLILTDSENNTVTIPLADISTGADTNTTNVSLTQDGTNLILTDSDTNTVTIPLATLAGAIDTNTTSTSLTQDGTDLILTDSENNTVRIPLADINTGADANTTNASLTEDGTNLILTDSDTNTVTIPLATLAAAIDTDTNTTNATLTEDGTDLILTDSDGTEVRIALADISTGADTNTTNASLTEDGTDLILTDSDGTEVRIALATLTAAIDTDTNTTNATLTEDGTDLILTDSDGTEVRIALADISTGADTNTTNASLTEDGTDLILTDSDGTEVRIALATLTAAIDTDTNTTNATLTEDGTDLILTDSDGTEVRIALADISTGADTNTTNASLTEDGTDLILTDSDGTEVRIALATLTAAIDTDTNTTNATLTEDGTDLILTDSDGTEVRIALADISTGTDTNLALNNLTLDAARTHDLNGNNMVFTGTGDVGIGNFGVGVNPAAPTSKFHVLGQIRASSMANGDGSTTLPAYRFENDLNSGMWSAGGSELAFSAGSKEALRIDGTGADTKVIVQNDLELEQTLTDVDGDVGIAGQVLSSTGTGVDWITPAAAAAPTWASITGKPTDFDDNQDQNFANYDLIFDAPRTHVLSGNTLTIGGTGNIIFSGPTNVGNDQKLFVDGAGRFVGILNSNGSVGEPSYRFNDDTNTGIFRAAEDELAFSTEGIETMRIDEDQEVGIGTDDPTAKLHVVGDSLFDGNVTVINGTVTVPDYVFQKYFQGFSVLSPDYTMPTLKEIEAFAKKYNHLPGIPSAAEISENGLEVNKALFDHLEKIEELFLHTIEQQKKIENLSQENQDLKTELNSLKAEVEAIKVALRKQ